MLSSRALQHPARRGQQSHWKRAPQPAEASKGRGQGSPPPAGRAGLALDGWLAIRAGRRPGRRAARRAARSALAPAGPMAGGTREGAADAGPGPRWEPLAGRAYVRFRDGEPGLGSYHFASAGEAHISYESELCGEAFPRLDCRAQPAARGERLPQRLAFGGATYDAERRTFRGSVSFSLDAGSYEVVRTVDGVEREEHELVFSEDLEHIVEGRCLSFYPNASRPHRCDPLGAEFRRWRPPGGAACLGADAAAEGGAAAAGVSAGSSSAQPDAGPAAAAAVLGRDLAGLRRALAAGAAVDTAVAAEDLWRATRCDPGPERSGGPPPRAVLLTAAVLLQWPEGAALCVSHGADVNNPYAGPLRGRDGSWVAGVPGVSGTAGVPLLRVALSARGPAQCLLCRHLLDGNQGEPLV